MSSSDRDNEDVSRKTAIHDWRSHLIDYRAASLDAINKEISELAGSIDDSESMSTRTASSLATEPEIYRKSNLSRNNFRFLDVPGFINNTPELAARRPELQTLRNLTNLSADAAVDPACISDTLRARLNHHAQEFTVHRPGIPGCYRTVEVIEQAVALWERLRPWEGTIKDNRLHRAIEKGVWDFFALEDCFSESIRSEPWYPTDKSIFESIPARHLLKKAEPEYAIGLPFPLHTFMHRQMDTWKDRAIPSVNLRVTSELNVPFFIFESKAGGALRTVENQLANSMLRAHDILCSLGLNQSLYILGAVQLGMGLNCYVSFSTRGVNDKGEAYCESVYQVRYAKFDLNEVNGCLQFLQFVEYVKRYGLTTFKESVEAVLTSSS